MTVTLGRRVGSAAIWSATNTSVLRLASFAASLIVARLVAPYEFGVFAVALTAFTIFSSVAELGVVAAIVREPDRTREMAPTIFTISLITSAILTVAMIATAPLVASALGSPQAAGAIRVLSLFTLTSAFSQVPAAVMWRDYMQRQRFITDVAFFVVSTAVMLILVLAGDPVMGLAWSRVAGQVVLVAMIIWLSPEWYWPGFSRREAKHLLAFGLPLAAANIVTLLIANVDFVTVGHMLHAQELGYYQLAFNISGWPLSIFGAVALSVALPTLARVMHDPPDLSRHLHANVAGLCATAFPIAALLAGLAGPLISTVYGGRWQPAWIALVALAVFGAVQTVLLLLSKLLVALGLTRTLLWINVAWIAVLIPTMIFCVSRWGILGAGIANTTVALIVVVPAYVSIMRRTAHVSLSVVSGGMITPFVASLAAGAAAFAVTVPFSSNAAKFLVGAIVGLLVYVALAARWLRGLAGELRTLYWARQ